MYIQTLPSLNLYHMRRCQWSERLFCERQVSVPEIRPKIPERFGQISPNMPSRFANGIDEWESPRCLFKVAFVGA
jgi:hypothetical protein